MKLRKYFRIALTAVSCLLLGYWFVSARPALANQASDIQSKGVMLLSISSDGRYVIGNENTQMILWDVEKQTRTVVSEHANIYSAYFIKNSPFYMYQDLDNIVHVYHVNGMEVKQFQLDFPTYGHVMTTDLQRYFASDFDWRIVKYENGVQQIVKGLDEPKGFYHGKLLNLTLSSDDTQLLSVGITLGGREPDGYKPIYHGKEEILRKEVPYHQSALVLWDTATGDPLMLSMIFEYKSAGTLSPKGDYIVGTDEQLLTHFKYHLLTEQYEHFIDYEQFAIFTHSSTNSFAEQVEYGEQMLQPYDSSYRGNGIQVKFITDTDYLLFMYNNPYVHVHHVDAPYPISYEFLGESSLPSVNSFLRNASLDTAPAVHRLVTGKAKEPGIMVYDYDPETHTLTKIWDSR